MYAEIELIGRLTRKPNLQFSPTGMPICTFSVAVNKKGKGETDNTVTYFDIIAFRNKAELCAEYLDTGKLVFVKGDPQIRKWEDKDGKKHSKFEIVLQNIRFLSAKPTTSKQSTDREDDFVHEPDDDDIPL
ncbi:MAG: Single-stranded DNA-binding protein [Syntrophorhabdaceae bacterium PtaU1.Bin034]|jgi:single-strand DNA-binding protein|nr:MAG: Single-stranded DNA-binding protein [Syntrophorhabdaceae bacterium PtaU1.Bin034]